LFALLFYAAWLKKQRVMLRFAQLDMLKKISNSVSTGRWVVKMSLILLASLFLILALVRPQWGRKMELVERRGLDIILVQDVSLSMLAEDIQPNRLVRSKHEISDFISRLTGDRVGLVAFAGEAQLLCPLTMDYGAVRIFLNDLNSEYLMPGTNLAAGMDKAMQAFKAGKSQRKYQLMILLSDGEEHTPQALEIAEAAAKEGVAIYTVGIGSISGVHIPSSEMGGAYKKDSDGNLVTTRLDQETLQQIAFRTGGKYFHAGPGDFELQKILSEISNRERQQLDGTKVEQFQDRFQIPLLIAIILFLLESFVSDRQWTRKVWKGRFQ
jgi:Ca-activated chloride channel family protein